MVPRVLLGCTIWRLFRLSVTSPKLNWEAPMGSILFCLTEWNADDTRVDSSLLDCSRTPVPADQQVERHGGGWIYGGG
jgi:hypothetical protein